MPPKPKPGGGKEDDIKSMLGGISCAHSWIKTQTMIRPTKLGKTRGDGSDESGEEDDDVAIVLTSRDPNVSYGRLWWFNILSEASHDIPCIVGGSMSLVDLSK